MPHAHPATLLQTILACRQYAKAYCTSLEAGAATAPVNQLGAAFAAVDLTPVLSLGNAHRVFRWVRKGWLVQSCAASELLPHRPRCAHVQDPHPTHPHPHTHATTRPPCSEAYGYESWLLGPERGVRGLVAEALELLRWVVDAGRWAGGTL
jgi:hypothetical protein